MDETISRHYSRGGIAAAIKKGLEATIGTSRPVTIDDLAAVDEFHIGGRQATVHLFEQIELSAKDHVLDIGAGIGGTARYVAHTFGCRVTGIDLTPEYCEVAAELSALVGIQDRVNVRRGSALAMPFEPGSFDAAYMIHVGMNIRDKPALFAEVRRVLRPGGALAVYDVMRGPTRGPLKFPVPWAATPGTSFVSSPEEVQAALQQAGFEIEAATDRTGTAIEFFESLASSRPASTPAIGLHLLLGSDVPLKVANMIANVRSGLCGPWEIIARSKGDRITRP